jgi:hypothetical protein
MIRSTPEKKITIPSSVVYDIWYWYEGIRDPDNPVKPLTISVEQTGIGPTIKVFIETKPGEGVYKDFTDYNSW